MTSDMTTSLPSTPSTPRNAPETLRRTTPGRAWALSGLGAGLCGIAVFMLAPGVADFPDSAMADNADLVTYLDGTAWVVWVSQVLTVVAAGLLAVFGAGLRRRLAEQEPVGSLLPGVAMAGALLTAAMCLVGGGISTELFWHLVQEQGASDPDTIAANLAVFNTMPWVWAGLGLSSGAVAIAALRHGSVPRWLGWLSVAMTALIGLTQVVPLQYLALAPGSIWLVAAGIGLARRERSA